MCENHLSEMNSCKPGRTFLPKVRAEDLTIDRPYAAEIIRKIKTRYGDSYVLQSDEFQIFLPRHFLKVDIPEMIPGRCFKIVDLKTLSNGRKTPTFIFFMNKM